MSLLVPTIELIKVGIRMVSSMRATPIILFTEWTLTMSSDIYTQRENCVG